MEHNVFNMHTMYAYCPEEIAVRNLRFAYSTFTSSTNIGAESIRKELTDFLCTNIFGIDDRDSLVLNSGSEANEIALFLSKLRTNRRIVVTSNLAHSSIAYAAKKLGLDVKTLFTVDPKTYQILASDLTTYLTEHGDEIAMLNVTYGTTQLGTTEDFLLNEEVRRLCRDKGVWLHVDAAFGAFYLHSLGQVPSTWQEAFKAADSITVDPYKFIGLPTSGILILRDSEYKKLLNDEVTYFKGTTTALGTTRSVLPAATSLDIIRTLGSAGLKELSNESLAKARHITDWDEEERLSRRDWLDC